MIDPYHRTRFEYDERRKILWQSLWSCYFSSQVRPTDCVLDLGCGYGDFINSVIAARRIAVDSWPGCRDFLDLEVEALITPVTNLSSLENSSVDFAFASNLLEHLEKKEIAVMLAGLRDKLRPNGTLTILQPNWKYAFRDYFDDFTHVSIWSHVSMSDFLRANEWEVIDVLPRFLPLSLKSRLPVHPWLIRAWLMSPVKPIGKQMLIKARPAR
jgi:SAM-dependent methyltransferase